jgi:aspartyl-tRNA(Asn)/glutamyl-tRNA(Gln) amidotransferase subunit A
VDVAGIFLARPEWRAGGAALAVKDLFDTAGLTTTYGSVIFAEHVPDRSAEAVRRLEAAGYALAGKTNLHEFAYGITSQNPWFGTVPNPLAPGRIAGGSSGGSAAALAAELAEAALGSDSGGSIRVPAACCGVVGLKPRHGLVSLDGCFPLAPSFATAGPMARSVRECEAMMAALAPGLAPRKVESLEELKVGIAWTAGADSLVRQRVEAAAGRFPRRRELDLPLPPEAVTAVFRREVADVHRDLFAAERDRYGDNVRIKIEQALAVDDDEYEDGLRARESYREQMSLACQALDLVVTPTLGFVAPSANKDDLELREAVIRFTFPFNVLGWPALAIPCGAAEHGLPASVQLVCPSGDEALLLAAGKALEAVLSRGSARALVRGARPGTPGERR